MQAEPQVKMLPAVEAVWEQSQRILNETFKWADGLSDEQLNWRPKGKDTNTLGNLISHIMGLGLFAVTERIGGQSTGRDRNAEFTAPVTREVLNQRRAECETRIRDTLSTLTSADLERAITTPAGGGQTTVLKLLVFTVSHMSQHMGQVIVTRKLLDGQG
jgi:uncharacterized damage-inducible protein DinB